MKDTEGNEIREGRYWLSGCSRVVLIEKIGDDLGVVHHLGGGHLLVKEFDKGVKLQPVKAWNGKER